MDMNTKVKVINRNRGSVSYKIESLRIARRWSQGAELLIPLNELIELRMTPGGETLLRQYLLIEDQEALRMIFDEDVEPEYLYTEKEVEFLLYEGTSDQLLDALDYAPEGVLNLIRKKAIERKPDTTAKVDILNTKFKINLNRIIENAGDAEAQVVEVEQKRRSTPVVKAEKTPSASKYNVIKK